jgi:hypothetical protein
MHKTGITPGSNSLRKYSSGLIISNSPLLK